jgi:hypothetical protein
MIVPHSAAVQDAVPASPSSVAPIQHIDRTAFDSKGICHLSCACKRGYLSGFPRIQPFTPQHNERLATY